MMSDRGQEFVTGSYIATSDVVTNLCSGNKLLVVVHPQQV